MHGIAGRYDWIGARSLTWLLRLVACVFCGYLLSALGANPASAAPTITSFSPTSGLVGTSVTITGTNFSATPASNTVMFNGTAATVSAATTTHLTVAVPTGATTGTITVKVGTQTATSSSSFTVTTPVPTITGFSPASGPVGSTVAINGTNFSTTPSSNTVKFHNTTASVSAATTTQLTVTVPSGATTGTITVKVGTQTATSSSSYTVTVPPTISSFSPADGVVGATVVIQGANFSATKVNNAVSFNGTSATVVSATTTKLTITVPAGATTGPIAVTVAGQTATSAAVFVVDQPPTLSGFAPAQGPFGTEVTISGSNLGTVENVFVGGFGQAIEEATDSQLTITIGDGTGSGPIEVDTDYGIATTDDSFYVTSPIVYYFTPTAGPVSTVVTIEGNNFDLVPENNGVSFNGTPAVVLDSNGSELTVSVPFGATTGTVAVARADQSATSTDTFTVQGIAFSPAQGPVGTTVTITGYGFFDSDPANDTVTFNGVPAQIASANAYSLQALVPAGATTGPITVSANGTTATTITNYIVGPAFWFLFDPQSGPRGTLVTITCEFGDASSMNGSNIVAAFGAPANGGGACPQFTINVPTSATTGLVNVAAGDEMATSEVPFTVTQGPFTPIVSGFNPAGGQMGSTATLQGLYPSFGSASVNGVATTYSDGSFSQCTYNCASKPPGPTAYVPIPQGATTGPIIMQGTPYLARTDGSFELPALPPPTVTSVSPLLFAVGDQVTIRGENFAAEPENNIVSIGSNGDIAVADIMSATTTELQVIVPLLSPGIGGVEVVSNGQVGGYGPLINTTLVDSNVMAVKNVDPPSARVGDVVTIHGQNFSQTNNVVTFNVNGTPVLVTPSQSTATQLQVAVPLGAVSDEIQVGTQAYSAVETYFIVDGDSEPTFSPAEGQPGTVVTVVGTGFDPGEEFNPEGNNIIWINGQSMSILSASATQLTFTVSSNVTDGPIEVVSNGIHMTSQGSFHVVPPVISSFTPTSGVFGTTLTITGSALGSNSYRQQEVMFAGSQGSVPATVMSGSDTQLIVQVPDLASSGPLQLNLGGYVSHGTPVVATSSTIFTVNSVPPSISGFSPSSGPADATVTINGAGFDATASNNRVLFNGFQALVMSASSSQLTVKVPTGATTGLVQVVERNMLATSTDAFTVNSMQISGIAPTNGTIGTVVTITGQNFGTGATTQVTFNGHASDNVHVLSATAITATVPGTATDGPIQITVGGQSATSAADFAVAPPPMITGLSPTSGRLGAALAILGQNFSPDAANNTVYFSGGSPQATVTSASSTELDVVVRNGAATGPVQVIVGEGQPVFSTDSFIVLPPSISGFSPATGPPGTTVTISGDGFDTESIHSNGVTFNGVPASVLNATSTQISVTVPAQATSGPIVVTVDALPAVTVGNYVVTPPVPTINSFTPTTGAAGTTVQISGANFSTDAASNTVTFNGTPAVVISAYYGTYVYASVPAGATTGRISVTVNGVTATSATDFVVPSTAPTITSFSPPSGTPGTIVTINGTNFSATLANNSVTFNGTPATVTSAATTKLVATVPAGATTGPISVTVAGQTGSSANTFVVVVPAPTISSFTPNSGPVGTLVTVNGGNFAPSIAGNTISFNGVPASVVSATPTQLTTTVPEGATTGPIQVATGGQTAISGNNYVVSAPTLSIVGFSPLTGRIGTIVTITGVGFSTSPTSNLVSFNGTAATVTSATAMQIVAVVPPGTTTGPIVVQSNGSLATSSSNFTVLSPVVSEVLPASGTPGTDVTFTGSNLLVEGGDTTVAFNGSPALVSYASSTQVIASVPSGATSGPIAVVVNGVIAIGSPSFNVVSAGSHAANLSVVGIEPEPSIVNQVYTVQLAINGGAGMPTGTIVVFDGFDTCAIDLPNNSCTLPGSTVPGDLSVTAYYYGDSNYQIARTSRKHVVNPPGMTEMCGLDPWATASDAPGFVPLAQFSGAVYSSGIDVDITGQDSLSAEIDFPTAGQTVYGNAIDVAGTFSGPRNTGISINGVIAKTVGNKFVAYGVPLSSGANALTLSATTMLNSTFSIQTSVNQSSGSNGPVDLSISNASRDFAAPAYVGMSVDVASLPNNATVSKVEMDADGDGIYELSVNAIEDIPVKLEFQNPGLFNSVARITDSQGNHYYAHQFVLIDDMAARRSIMCDIYGYLKSKLSSNDAASASLAYQPMVRDAYKSQFDAWSTYMAYAGENLGFVMEGRLAAGYAELMVVRDNSDGTRSGFPIRVTQGIDGVWRISEM